jgi:hypothetical protein
VVRAVATPIASSKLEVYTSATLRESCKIAQEKTPKNPVSESKTGICTSKNATKHFKSVKFCISKV